MENIQIVSSSFLFLAQNHLILQPFSQTLYMDHSTTSLAKAWVDYNILFCLTYTQTYTTHPFDPHSLVLRVFEPLEIGANTILYDFHLIYLPSKFEDVFVVDFHDINRISPDVDISAFHIVPLFFRGHLVGKSNVEVSSILTHLLLSL